MYLFGSGFTFFRKNPLVLFEHTVRWRDGGSEFSRDGGILTPKRKVDIFAFDRGHGVPKCLEAVHSVGELDSRN